MKKFLIIIVWLFTANALAQDYIFRESEGDLSVSVMGKIQAGIIEQKFETRKLFFKNDYDIDMPVLGFYLIHQRGGMWGPKILEHIQGHTPLIERHENEITIYFIAGARTHIKQIWHWNGSSFVKMSETGIDWSERPSK